MTGYFAFGVTVEPLTDGYRVRVSDGDGGTFAQITAPSPEIGLRMAVPYMLCVVEPDPLAALARMATTEAAAA